MPAPIRSASAKANASGPGQGGYRFVFVPGFQAVCARGNGAAVSYESMKAMSLARGPRVHRVARSCRAKKSFPRKPVQRRMVVGMAEFAKCCSIMACAWAYPYGRGVGDAPITDTFTIRSFSRTRPT